MRVGKISRTFESMMRWLLVTILGLFTLSCTVRRPTLREPIVAEYQRSNRSEVIATLNNILKDRQIPISKTESQNGFIVSDSFEVIPEYCDCGMNFFGAQYPGRRRGLMRIAVTGDRKMDIKFEFTTLLTIRANNRQVKCTSFGILENEILTELEKSLGIVRDNAQN